MPVPLDLVSSIPHVINVPMRIQSESQHFVCLTIGSRGDVQPYIALGKGLLAEGHKVTIVTHEEYKEWIESWGIQHRTAGGDPGALMKLSVENKVWFDLMVSEKMKANANLRCSLRLSSARVLET